MNFIVAFNLRYPFRVNQALATF